MANDDQRLNRYLNEALAMERALISTLSAHVAMTPNGAYRRLLQRHLRETREHAAAPTPPPGAPRARRRPPHARGGGLQPARPDDRPRRDRRGPAADPRQGPV